MKITRKYHTQNGLTLVEVLAALVILGIVFISIMTIFPQMTLFNEKTETKLDTMNIARQEMAKLTGHSYLQDDFNNLSSQNISADFIEALNVDMNGIKIPDPKLYNVAKINNVVMANHTSYEVTNVDSNFMYYIHVKNTVDLEGTVSLYKIILEIYQIKNDGSTSFSSETYGYLEAV